MVISKLIHLIQYILTITMPPKFYLHQYYSRGTHLAFGCSEPFAVVGLIVGGLVAPMHNQDVNNRNLTYSRGVVPGGMLGLPYLSETQLLAPGKFYEFDPLDNGTLRNSSGFIIVTLTNTRPEILPVPFVEI